MPNQIFGTSNNDTLNGTSGDDEIEGLAGNDQLYGGSGDDIINGGDGSDLIYGDAGNDILNGGSDNDALLDNGGGNDSLFGGQGNDTIQLRRVDLAAAVLVLDGGDGDDLFIYNAYLSSPAGYSVVNNGDAITASGGDGNDRFAIGLLLSLTLDAGGGTDWVQFDIATTTGSITLGLGADILDPQWWTRATLGAIVVQDFAAGLGGDRVLFDVLATTSLWDWSGENPFGNGLLRLVESGADTLVQLRYPNAPAAEYRTIFTLKNVTASSLTQDNLSFNPTGGVTAGVVLDGTALADRMLGFGGNDTINGLDGEDWIDGYAGNDLINGGDGRDSIFGGYGNDTIYGGAGNDSLNDSVGSDSLFGEAGDDGLYYSTQFGPAAGTVLLDGGIGNDSISYFANQRELDTVTAIGGLGHDIILVGLAAGTTILAGDGNDNVVAELLGGAVQVDLGAGIDLLSLTQYSQATHGQLAPVVVTGFAAGVAGDTLFLNQVMASRVANWDGTDDPFSTGHLRMIQQGADTHVQIDRNGGGDNFATFAILSGVILGALAATQVVWQTGFNYWQFSAGSPLNDFGTGGDGIDFYMGGMGDDNLHGAGGNDTLIGDEGNDTLYGDAGFDRLFGGEGDDSLHADSSDVLIDGGIGIDKLTISTSGSIGAALTGLEAIELVGGAVLTLTGTQVSSGFSLSTAVTGTGALTINMTAGQLLPTKLWSITSGIAFTINGTAGTDIMKLANAVQTVNGGDGQDQIKGGNLVDTINGGAGIDKIMGQGGADILTGGLGNDVFRYLAQGDSGLGAATDRITDFAIGQDRLNFKDIDADAVTIGDQAFTFLGTAAFAATGLGQIRYFTSGGDLIVQADVNGDGAADMEVVLQGLAGQVLGSSDFVL